MQIQSRGNPGGGGTDLERGYGDVRPWRPSFHASPVVRKGPISSKSVSWPPEKIWKFLASTASIFAQILTHKLQNFEIFSSQAPNLEIFQFRSPVSEANTSSQAPHFGNPGRTPLLKKKKSWVPPGGNSPPPQWKWQKNK